jgi:hypothetical protein
MNENETLKNNKKIKTMDKPLASTRIVVLKMETVERQIVEYLVLG